MVIFYLILSFFFSSAEAANSFSYSGRLVTSAGAPATGPAKLTFDLIYSSQPSSVLCTQTLNEVELANGVFHVKLDFPSCNLHTIFLNTPDNHTVSIRVTDNTSGLNKVYSYQAIHSVPYAFISETSKQLDSMEADTGEVLTWDGTKWAPADLGDLISSTAPSGAAGGALTGTYPNPGLAPIAQSNVVNLVSDLNSKIGLGQLSATLPLVYNNATGAFSLDSTAADKLNDLELLPSGDGLIERAGGILVSRTCDSGEVLKWFSPAGWTCSEDSAVDSDKLPLAGGTLSGDLILETQLQIKNGVSHSIVIKTPNSNTDYTLTLPSTAGGANQVLTTNGAGVLTWETPATSAAPSGPAGGALDGTYPNPTLKDIPQSKITNLVSDLSSKIGLTDLSATAPLIYNSGAFSISEATTSASGALSASDKTKLDSLEIVPASAGLIERHSGTLRSRSCSVNEVLKWNGASGWNCATDDDTDETKLPLTGGTLTGPLFLAGSPTDNLHAAPKSYVDSLVSNTASKWGIVTGGINYSGGNVGIGVATPSTKLDINGQIKISGGSPGLGKVLTSDGSGLATWQAPSAPGDNLGNHTATQNINLSSYKLVGGGGTNGISIDNSGNVSFGTSVGVTIGPNSTVGSGWGSLAGGFMSTASSISTFAFGTNVTASNWYAFASGENTTASGRSSAAFGEDIVVSGSNSIGFGLSQNATPPVVSKPSTMAIMGGNVGINTTDPQAKLDVAGEARATSVGGEAFGGQTGIKFDFGTTVITGITAANPTICKTINFTTTYTTRPKVTATVNHSTVNTGPGMVHDPMGVWIEEITTTYFEACVRDLSSALDHENVDVDWIAIGK